MSDQVPGAPAGDTTAAPPKVGRSCAERIARGIGCALVIAVGLCLLAVWFLQNAFKGPVPEPVVPELRTVQKTVVLSEGAAIHGHVAASWNEAKSELATISISIGAPNIDQPASPSPVASGSERRPPFVDAAVELRLGTRGDWGCTAPCELGLSMLCKQSCSLADDVSVELLAPPGTSASVVVTLAVIAPLKKSLPGGLDAKLDLGP